MRYDITVLYGTLDDCVNVSRLCKWVEILQYTIKKIPFLYLSCSWLLFLDSKTTKVRKREESFEFQIYEIKNTESNNSLKIEYIKHDVSRIHFRRARAPQKREGKLKW